MPRRSPTSLSPGALLIALALLVPTAARADTPTGPSSAASLQSVSLGEAPSFPSPSSQDLLVLASDFSPRGSAVRLQKAFEAYQARSRRLSRGGL